MQRPSDAALLCLIGTFPRKAQRALAIEFAPGLHRRVNLGDAIEVALHEIDG